MHFERPSLLFRFALFAAIVSTLIIGAGCGTGGGSTVSSSGSNAPPPPTTPGTHEVDLSWKASNSPQVTGYLIYRRSTGSTNYVLLNPTPISALTYADIGLEGGQSLYYSVTAVDTNMIQSQPTPDLLVVIP